MTLRILLVDDDRDSRAAVSWFLKDQEHEVTECAGGEEALAALGVEDYPMVLSDISMPGMTGIELAKAIKQQPHSWRTDVVLFTGYGDMHSAIEALRAGVYDFLQKPVDAQTLAALTRRIEEHQALLRENKTLSEQFHAAVHSATEESRRELTKMKQLVAESFVGKVYLFSEEMGQLAEQARKFHTDRTIPVLIEGETGTGKEIVAKLIHHGGTFDKGNIGNFVDINCAAIAPTLFESELFGYEAGAFTGGAARGQKGKFDLASGGTLFLDEVGEIPLELQGKLLRVLQEREFYRVGGLKKVKVDVRIICATNQSLKKRCEEGAFRKDLYYRLKVGHLIIPPLRERKGEIVPLAGAFLRDAATQKGKKFTGIHPETGKLLEQHPWPGNVRELKNLIEYATFANDGVVMQPWHIAGLLPDASVGGEPAVLTESRHLLLPFPEGGYSLRHYNDDIILQVLASQGGNQTETARYLAISLRALAYRLEQLRGKKKKPLE